jgi:hypothetical protein
MTSPIESFPDKAQQNNTLAHGQFLFLTLNRGNNII